MDPKRETAVDDTRETRAGDGIRLNRHDRRAAKKIERQIADVDRQIARLEKEGATDASQE